MIITYHGVQFFKIQQGDLTIAINPISKESKVKGARFGSDVALVSLNHPDFNGIDAVTYGDKTPFVISGPGEYEIKEMFIRGFLTYVRHDTKEKRINTIYYITLEGVKLLFLGSFDSGQLPEEIEEAISEVDIMFVPIGGRESLTPADAQKLTVLLEPKMVIPMQYTDDVLKRFLKEAGEEAGELGDKLTIRKKDFEGKDGEVILFKVT